MKKVKKFIPFCDQQHRNEMIDDNETIEIRSFTHVKEVSSLLKRSEIFGDLLCCYLNH